MGSGSTIFSSRLHGLSERPLVGCAMESYVTNASGPTLWGRKNLHLFLFLQSIVKLTTTDKRKENECRVYWYSSPPRRPQVCCSSVCLFHTISFETAKRIWLKFCTERYVPDTVSHMLVAIALEYPRGEPKIWFLPRDAMHKRGICRRAVSVCLSVFLSVYHIRVFCRND